MVSLGQKLKSPKTGGKWLYKHIRVVLCKKRLAKRANIREMRRFWKLQKWPLSKGYSLCKMVSLGRKLKWPKTGHKWHYKHIRVVLCKKRFDERANIQKMRRFWKLAKMATMQGYSLPYMVSLGQRLKSPKTGQNWLYKLTRIVLSKKTLGKNWWYWNNETVWKIGKNGHSVKAITFAKRSVWVKD